MQELGKREKKGGGEGGGKEENEPAGMTFNLESSAYRFSMLKSHWSCEEGGQGILCITTSRSPSVATQRKQSQRYKEVKRFLSRFWKNFEAFPGHTFRSQ